MKNRLHRTNMWKLKQYKQKLGFLGDGIIHAKTGLRTHEFSLRVHAHTDPYPENLIYTKTEKKPNKT